MRRVPAWARAFHFSNGVVGLSLLVGLPAALVARRFLGPR
jgi:hypothetical protein